MTINAHVSLGTDAPDLFPAQVGERVHTWLHMSLGCLSSYVPVFICDRQMCLSHAHVRRAVHTYDRTLRCS